MSRPDAVNHNPDEQYLRGLIEKSGLSQRECARRLGITSASLRHMLSDCSQRKAPYTVQYALEELANAKGS